MKKILSITLLLLALTAGYASAQTKTDDRKAKREQLAMNQARYIVKSLGLDDERGDRFVDVYCKAQREVWDLGPRTGPDRSARSRQRTDAETERDLKNRFDRSQKLLDIRQKYYHEYSKFLTQKQIQRVYELEKGMKERLRNKQRARRQNR